MVDTPLLMPRESREAEELRGYLRGLADALLKVKHRTGCGIACCTDHRLSRRQRQAARR